MKAIPTRYFLSIALILIAVLIAAPAMAAATTSVHVIRYANDGTTILNDTAVDFHWMEANLPVYGDGITHYYMQGPVFNASITNKWNPEENDPAILTKDFGAVKGTDVKDLCNLVGGMYPGDNNVTLMASDGFSKSFAYSSIYNPPPRAGPVVLAWYRADEGYVDSGYSTGMRNVMLADTSVNPWGDHVFGLWDMHETYPEAFWYYYQPGQPSATGLSVQNINRVLIYSNDPAPVVVTLFDGTVNLASGDKATVTAYNSGSSYSINTTTPLGALDSATKTAGIPSNISDKNFATKGILMLDGIGPYLYNKNAGLTWICQVNGVTLDDYGNPATDGLNLKSLSNGDQVNYYYGMKPLTPENATAVVKIKANIQSPGPVVDTLFDGSVNLASGGKATVTAYNSGSSYSINTTTPLGALNSATNIVGLSSNISDKNFATKGILMLDGIGQYLYNKNAGLTWICQVNGVTLDDYGSPATDGLNLKSLSNGDQVNYYYGMKPVTPENATAVVKIKANISGQPPISDWTLSLVGAQSRSVTKTYFEQGLACPSSGHQVFWTDTDNNTWGGVPLWFLVGMVDDNPDVGPYHFNFNDTIAAQGYSVKVISADGWDTTLSSQNIARNDGYIVANTLNGQPLPRNTTSGKLSWPLHLKGSATFGGQQVGNITKIELTGLPKPVTAWTLTMKGEVTDNITQAYFVDAIACKHNVTWTDSNNDVWQGVALWDLVGAVDDIETTDHFTFNDTRAAENYTVRVSAGDGYNATFISSDVARNDGYIVAYRMNGVPITGSEAPLKLVGPSTTRGSQRIGNITMISLEGLPDQFPPGNWQLQLVGKISAVIPQPEFEYWASCHDATYTDTTGNVYTGVPLWRLMGWVDDRIPHGPNGFNDAAALAGYKVIVKAGDGYEKEFTSQQIGKNDNFIVADTMNGAPLPTTGSHPPYPLRLVGNDVIVANSVGNIVQIQLTDFQTPVTYPPVHIIKYAPDRITIINQTNVTYPWMEANLPVIGDGVTTYKFEGLTMDPSNLWDPEETYPGGFKISNVVKGTRVKDLVELVGGMGSGTEITFVSSDGLELPLPYSSIYTNPAVQDRQGDAILAWWGDGKYVPNYGDGIRLFFMPEGDHVYGQWDMHETLPPAYWHYNFQNGIQYPSCAGISAKFVTTVRVYSSPESDWSLELDGRDIGGINATISKTYFEDALACQFGAEHSTTYTDSSGQVWGGMPLWFLCGYVDDADQHSKQSYNESKALAGYNISVAGAGGDSYTIDSRNTIRNSNYIVANTLNGTHLSTTDPSWPLRLVGQNVSVTNSVKKVASVTLKQFTPNPATTSVQVIKYANDGRTILGQRTVDFQWMQANLPVYGDGVTHYYHQGPVMNASIPDKWNPEENDPAILTKDLGAVKGTNIQDLCNLAGGMSPGDYNVTLMASDGLSRPFSYASVYSPPPRAGPIVLTWYRADQGYVNNSYSEGMRNINFANTAVNPWGLNVFGVWDMHETYPEAFWYYYQPGLPSAMGVSIKNINRVLIYSAEPAPSTPVAAFTADVTSGQAPLTVGFTDTSSGNPTSWNWNFGDGTANETARNPSHQYQNTGTYDVTLTASNADGSSTLKKSHYISVISPGTISVTVIKYANDGRTILGQRTVDFQWMQANLPVYGDGVTHYYHQGPVMNASIPDKWNPEENDPAILTKDLGAVKGTNIQDLCNLAGGMSPEDYNVTLMASDGLSRPFSYSSVYSPAPRAGPIVLTWYRADQGYVNSSYSEGMRNINFANTAVNPWGLNVFGVWDMHETYPEAFWYYYQPGLPSAMGVSIKNINRVLIYSAEPAPSAPVAAFTADVTSGQAPLTVEFTDTSSGNPTSWNWNFGDGTANVTTKNPSHLYQNTGTYDVTLTASNADGSSTLKKSQYISVRSPGLYADFTVSPVSGTAPLAVECADKSSGKPIFYLYNFGDGLYGTSPNSVHLYQFPGTYDITLTIMAFDRTTFSMKSSTMTKKNVVTVNSVPFIPPVAKFTASPVQGTSPLTVKFTDQSTGSPTFYSYNFGDGITRPGPNQDHIYQFPGTYTVTLTVMKNDGKGSIVSDTSIRKDLIVVQSK